LNDLHQGQPVLNVDVALRADRRSHTHDLLQAIVYLMDAPSLAELEQRFDQALKELCRPVSWNVSLDGEFEQMAGDEQGDEERRTDSDARVIPLVVAGQHRGVLVVEPAPEHPLSEEQRASLALLAQAFASGLHRLLIEIESLAHIAELTFVQAITHDPLPVGREAVDRPFAKAILQRFGVSSFQIVLPSLHAAQTFWFFAARRLEVALSPEQGRQHAQFVERLLARLDTQHQGYYIAEPQEVATLVREYDLAFLSQAGTLAYFPVQYGDVRLGMLILGEERSPERQPFSRLAVQAMPVLTRSLSMTLIRHGKLRQMSVHIPFLQTLVDHLDEALVAVVDGTISVWNPAACTLFGLAKDAALGRRLEEVLPSLPPQNDWVGQTIEWKQHTGDGNERVLLCTCINLAAYLGDKPCFMYMFRTVGQEHEMEYIKDEMLSSISHELRTQLSGIEGWSTLLLERPTMPEEIRQEGLELLQLSAERLTRIVNDFIDVIRARRGHWHLDPSVIPIGTLLSAVVFELQASHPAHQMIIDLAPDLPPVKADALRTKQIVINLIDNAAKYSPRDTTVVIRAWAEETMVYVAVSDQGIGIPVEARAHIFEPFYRSENARKFHSYGAGLGLNIVRSLVWAQGGQLSVQSSLHEGSTFTFSLPAMPQPGSGRGETS
jgi:signal transduction histidine kinase